MDQVPDEARRLEIKVRCQTVCVVVNRLQLSNSTLQHEDLNLHSLVDFTADGLGELR